jgi:hypothetical protein
METLSRIMLVTVDRGLLLSFSVGSRHNYELAVRMTLCSFVRLIVNNSVICFVSFYDLKQFQDRLIYQN